MIYLIKSYGYGGKSILKVGFTDNLKNRLSSYFYASPLSEVISIREGDEVLEKLLHIYLKYLGFQYKKNGKLDEWFLDNPEVRRIFHISQETLERIIWNNRGKIFDKNKLKSYFPTTDYIFFKYLYLKNKDKFIGEKIIFKDGKLIRTKSKEVDISFWMVYSKSNIEIKEEIDLSNFLSENIKIASEFLDNYFYKTGIFEEKMRMYCEFVDYYKDNREVIDIINHRITNPRFRQFYDYFGTSGCSSKKYRENLLLESWRNDSKEEELKKVIALTFKPGDRYPVKELKKILGDIYRKLGITKTPKATDLGGYFKLTKTKITLSDKTLTNGFRLDSLISV